MYDTIIIGAGPAGMTAALYAARSNLKVALLERGIPGGQMNNTADIENYPGYANISGPELAEKMFEPLENLGVEHLFGLVEKIEDRGDFKEIITEDERFEAKSRRALRPALLRHGRGRLGHHAAAHPARLHHLHHPARCGAGRLDAPRPPALWRRAAAQPGRRRQARHQGPARRPLSLFAA